MKTAGRIAVYVGIALTATGLLIGFGAMFVGKDDLAVTWLSTIPVGFVIMLAGTVASQLSGSRDEN